VVAVAVASLLAPAACGDGDGGFGGYGSPRECLDALVEKMGREISPSALAERCGARLDAAREALTRAGVAVDETVAPGGDEQDGGRDAAGSEPQAVMPEIPCGTDLQEAQDRVQAAGVFYSRSVDATGRGRLQILDRNWTVVRSSPAPGTPIGEGDPVFYVVKDEEFDGC
jgi:hypothetical protein